MRVVCVSLLVVALALGTATRDSSAQDWPSFRGPAARGVADGQNLPGDWDVKAGRNVRWKADVPGVGHSSPIVWGDRVFVTTAVPAEDPTLVLGDKGGIDLASDKPPISWRLLCFDAKDGKRLWEREAYAGEPRAARHVKSSHSNPTPVTDGKTVVALFASGTLAAFDVDGTPRWKRRPRHAQPGPARRPEVGVGPGQLAGHLREPGDRAGRQARGLVPRGVRPRDRQAGLARRARRAAGVGDADAPPLGRPRRAPRRRRLPRARLRPADRQGALALQGRRGGQDAHAVRERRPRDLRRRLSRPAALRDQGRRAGRRVRAREREERPVPGLAHRSGRALHHDAARLP